MLESKENIQNLRRNKMKIVDIIILIIFIGLCLLMANLAYAKPTGKSLICHQIGSLSSDCQQVEVLPMAYYDKEVALEEARSEKTYTTNNIKNVKINQVMQESKEQDEIIVKTWFEEAE